MASDSAIVLEYNRLVAECSDLRERLSRLEFRRDELRKIILDQTVPESKLAETTTDDGSETWDVPTRSEPLR